MTYRTASRYKKLGPRFVVKTHAASNASRSVYKAFDSDNNFIYTAPEPLPIPDIDIADAASRDGYKHSINLNLPSLYFTHDPQAHANGVTTRC
jgi:hypothetical protein